MDKSDSVNEKIVVGVDGSMGSVEALRWAMSVATAMQAAGGAPEVQVVHAMTPALGFGVDSFGAVSIDRWEALAHKTVDATVGEVPGAAEVCTAVVRHGRAATVLLQEAERLDAGLIVVGTRGAGWVERVILGSVSRRLVANDVVPVAVVPETAAPFGSPTIVGFDGSDGAASALRWAQSWCPGEIRALFSWAMPRSITAEPGMDLAKIEAAANQSVVDGVRDALGGSTPSRVVPLSRHGDPRTMLIRQSGAAQVVVGSRSRRGLPGLLAGSVSIYVAGHSPVTTIVVPPDQ